MAYRHVIMNLPADKIKNKVVLDLSKKSGHYAAFAARAGASKCYIMESSEKEVNETKTILSANGFEGKCEVQYCTSVDQVHSSQTVSDFKNVGKNETYVKRRKVKHIGSKRFKYVSSVTMYLLLISLKSAKAVWI